MEIIETPAVGVIGVLNKMLIFAKCIFQKFIIHCMGQNFFIQSVPDMSSIKALNVYSKCTGLRILAYLPFGSKFYDFYPSRIFLFFLLPNLTSHPLKFLLYMILDPDPCFRPRWQAPSSPMASSWPSSSSLLSSSSSSSMTWSSQFLKCQS